MYGSFTGWAQSIRFANKGVKLPGIKHIYWGLFLVQAALLLSCGGNGAKPEEEIVENFYEDSVSAATDTAHKLTALDSLLLAQADSLSKTTYDSTALKLKAKLVADSLSGRISDSLKKEIRNARDYMKGKMERSIK